MGQQDILILLLLALFLVERAESVTLSQQASRRQELYDKAGSAVG